MWNVFTGFNYTCMVYFILFIIGFKFLFWKNFDLMKRYPDKLEAISRSGTALASPSDPGITKNLIMVKVSTGNFTTPI